MSAEEEGSTELSTFLSHDRQSRRSPTDDRRNPSETDSFSSADADDPAEHETPTADRPLADSSVKSRFSRSLIMALDEEDSISLSLDVGSMCNYKQKLWAVSSAVCAVIAIVVAIIVGSVHKVNEVRLDFFFLTKNEVE